MTGLTIDISKLASMSLQEKVIVILKAIGSTNSITSPMASMLSDYQNHKQCQLINDILTRFVEMLKELDERVKNLEYINSTEFVCDILQTVDCAKNEIDENKRIMYAKYLIACCHIDNEKNRFKRIFLEYMGKMDGIDFYILKHLKTTFNGRDAVGEIFSMYNYEYKSNATKREIMNHFYYLTSLGIIEMSDQEEVEQFLKKHKSKISQSTFKKAHMFQRTTLGDDLYKFITKGEI